MNFRVEFTPSAEADLERLLGFLPERADTLEDAQAALAAIAALRTAAHRQLAITPYSFRKVGPRPTLRELIVPFGATGYILRFEIRSPGRVLVLGARHQREEDFG